MNAPWPNPKTHRLFQVPERGCSQGQRLGLHPAQTPPHTPRAGQEQAARIAEADMKADALEGVV
jgi:hypothetical protein